jgi:short-subunit dehydrogenase
MNFEGRTALVTGASAGIGSVIARALAERGVRVLASGRREEPLRQLCQELGGGSEWVTADLARPDDVARLGERAAQVDIFVSNAGLPASGALESFTPDEIDRALQVNLTAPIQLARALAPPMVQRGTGQLVFISSLLGKLTRLESSLYSAAKFGLRGFALALRQDLDGTGVGVSLVAPGFVSEVGMLAESGVTPPKGIRTSPPADVAKAVIDAIEHNKREIDVAPRPLRIAAVVGSVAPGLIARRMQEPAAREMARALSEAQRVKR